MMITLILESLTHPKKIEQKGLNSLCSVAFSNTNLKPSKLDKHFKRVYSSTEPGIDKETFKPSTFWLSRKYTKIEIYINLKASHWSIL